MLEFRDISRVSGAITAKRMKYCQWRNFSPFNVPFRRCIGYVDMAWRSPAIGRQTSARWRKQAIFELNASISLARWRWRLQHYFKEVVNLSATCLHVELEQFSACFRVARVCQRQLGFLVVNFNFKAI